MLPCRSLFALAAPLLLALCARAQVTAVNSANGKPLSQRVVAYWIDAKLNATAKTLDATEILEYRNPSDQPLTTIPFHLYLNAFRPQSTFSAEAHLGGTDVSYAKGAEGGLWRPRTEHALYCARRWQSRRPHGDGDYPSQTARAR